MKQILTGNYEIDWIGIPNSLNYEVKMMKNSKSLMIVLSLIFGIIASSQAQADISQIIQDGIAYLEDNQDESVKVGHVFPRHAY